MGDKELLLIFNYWDME